MPQTREHLAICSLLHIKSGLCVLTKRDLAKRLDRARAGRTSPRSSGAPSLRARPSSPRRRRTGEGLPELRRTLAGLARRVPPKASGRLPRLPIDRVVHGEGLRHRRHGDAHRGAARVDDRVEVYPRGIQAKIRGLQAHGHPVPEARAGQRTAVNLQGVERTALERGDVVGAPGTLVASVLVDGTLELLRDGPRPLKARDRVRFPHGDERDHGPRPRCSTGRARAWRVDLRALPARAAPRRPPRRSLRAPVLLAHRDDRRWHPPRREPAALQTEGARAARPPWSARAGSEAEVLEEHSGTRAPRVSPRALSGRVPFGPGPAAGAARRPAAGGALLAVDRDWFLHRRRASACGRPARVLEDFTGEPAQSGMSRESCAAARAVPTSASSATSSPSSRPRASSRSKKDKVRLGLPPPCSSRRSSRRSSDGIEGGVSPSGPPRPPRPEDTESELFQLLAPTAAHPVKEGLDFHATPQADRGKLVACFEIMKKEIGPRDIKSTLGTRRKFAIPLTWNIRRQRVTQRVGERRVLRGG